MNISALIGKKVIHKTLGEGRIIEISNGYITVEFSNKTSKFVFENFDQFFAFEDVETCDIITSVIESIKKEKAEAEAANKAAEEAAKRAAAKEAAEKVAEEAKRKDKKNQPIHPYIDQRRSNGKHVIFLVCQNANYEIESKHGFIWAPTHKGETDLASHAELEQVKAGDIIIHHFANHIRAISVAKKDCERKAPVAGHSNAGVVGRYVELSYHFLDTPADTSSLKNEKIKYGSMKYGPFEKTGKNKEGFYLSEVADELAKAFIEAAIAANPCDVVLNDFQKEI